MAAEQEHQPPAAQPTQQDQQHDLTAQREKAVALYVQGMTLRDIGKQLGMSYRSTYMAIEKSGVPFRPQGPGKKTRARIARRRAKVAEVAQDTALSIEAIAAKVGYSRATIVMDLRVLGIHRRAIHRAHAASAVMLYDANMSIRQISRELGLSYGCVRQTLINAGVELRARGGLTITPRLSPASTGEKRP